MEEVKGSRFGKLTAMRFVGMTREHAQRWQCKCDCGNWTTIRLDNLKRGMTKSCGCLRKRRKLDLCQELRK